MSISATETELQGLPLVSTTLLGRDELVARVVETLTEESIRLVTLIGPGGIGKTRVALAVAESRLPTEDRTVAFASLAAVTSADLVASAIANVLGVSGASDDPLSEQIADRLQERRTLLIVDNFEHVLDAAPLISWLLDQTPGLSVLVTSRSALQLSGEHVIEVPPLSLPGSTTDDDPLMSAAVQLYLERVHSGDADGIPGGESITEIAELCRQLDGLPLAIELAAASSALNGNSRSQAGSILICDPGHPADRQRTLSTTVAWSYGLLTPAEQTLLRRVSAFTGGFSLDAVSAIYRALDGRTPDGLIDDVVSLIDQSLALPLVEIGGQARGSMLQTIAQFGVDELIDRNELDACQRAMAAHYLEFAELAEPGLRGPDQLRWVQLIDADLGNIRSAIEFFRSRGDVELALRLASALGWYWSSPGHFHEGRDIYDRLLPLVSNEVSPEIRIKALESAADLEDWLMNLGKAQERYEMAVVICREIGDVARLVSFNRGLGSIALGMNDLPRAAALFTESIEGATATNDHWNLAASTNLLSVVRFGQGDYNRAIELSTQAMESWRAQGDLGHVVAGASTASASAIAAGRFALARDLSEFTLSEAVRLEDSWYRGRGVNLAGVLLIEAGRVADGISLMSFGEKTAEAIGTPLFSWLIDLYAGYKNRALESLGQAAYVDAWAAGLGLSTEDATRQGQDAFGALEEFWPAELSPPSELSRRELDVLRLIAHGKTDREIADELFIERRTVSKHVAAILEKLDVPNRSAAASTALRLGLV